MNWKQIFELIGAVFASIGGAGALIFALSSFFGKMWANKLLEKQKAEYQKDVEEYKSALSQELENVKATNEKLTYITKVQYDIEISAIKDLNCKAHRLVLKCFTLAPQDADELKKIERLDYRYNNFIKECADDINELMLCIGSTLAFVEKDVVNPYSRLLNLCRAQYELLKKVYKPSQCLSDENISMLCEKGKEISTSFTSAIETTRKYLKKVRVID